MTSNIGDSSASMFMAKHQLQVLTQTVDSWLATDCCQLLTDDYTLVLITWPQHGLHKKHCFQQYFYSCVCIPCRANVFTEPLSSNDGGYTVSMVNSQALFISSKEETCAKIMYLN